MPQITIDITEQQEAKLTECLTRGQSASLIRGTVTCSGFSGPIAAICLVMQPEHAHRLASEIVMESSRTQDRG